MFKYNKQEALAGATGGRIEETGPYEGVFTDVAMIVSADKGTKGLFFKFKTASGQVSDFSIYHESGTGEKLIGHNQIIALMTTMGISEVALEETRKVMIYGEETEVKCLKQMENVPVGIFLQRELSTWKNKHRDNMVYKSSFRVKDKRLADEIINDKEPKRYQKMVESMPELIDKRTALKEEGGFGPDEMRQPGEQQGNGQPPAGGGFDDFDDEIPF